MSTSALHIRQNQTTRRPLIAFVVGRYFAMTPDKKPDYNGISRNIEEAAKWTNLLWQAGFLVFTPHLNTHHFESMTRIDPDPLENEEYYRAFDRKLLMKGIDFIFATPNWRQSTGGRLEVQLACHLGIPVFESIPEAEAWADGGDLYSQVVYNAVSEQAKTFGEKKDLPIALIDGPFWAQNGAEVDFPEIKRHAVEAEKTAVALFNNKVAAFTPQLNASYENLGYAVPLDAYQVLCNEFLTRVADCHVLIPGWESDPQVRARIIRAQTLGKPSFVSINEVLSWNERLPDYSVVRIGG